MKLPLICLFCISILTLSCHRKSAPPVETAAPAIKSLIIDPAADASQTGDPLVIDDLRIVADTLFVVVNYSGGCKEHDIDLYFNGMYAKSLPVKATLFLKHNAHGDACRKLEVRELKFLINNLKPSGGNSVIVKLGDREAEYIVKE